MFKEECGANLEMLKKEVEKLQKENDKDIEANQKGKVLPEVRPCVEKLIGPSGQEELTGNVPSSPSEIYRREELLGKGSFARVYLVTARNSGEKFAVKTIQRELFASSRRKNFMEKVQLEIRIHERLSMLRRTLSNFVVHSRPLHLSS